MIRRRIVLAALAAAVAGVPALAVHGAGTASGASEDADDRSADEACGRDRRCRIERLKEQNRRRRLVRGLQTEDAVERIRASREEREQPPREKSPWGIDVRLTRLGLYGSWAFHPQAQVEMGLSSISGYGDLASGGGSSDFDATVVDLQVTGLVFDRPWSLYGSAGFTVMWGDGYSWVWTDEGGGSSSNTDITVHAFRLAAGIDALLLEKLRLRLGIVYQPHVYHQARLGPGQYDTVMRDSLNDWLERSVRFHPEIRIGFAFDL